MGRIFYTNVTEFILLGFSGFSPFLQNVLFTFFLFGYVLTLFGNGLIILTVTLDHGLHTPMYFFLRNLSFLELFFTTVTVPKVLDDLLSETRSISFVGCAAQMFVFFAIAISECVFLALMAFDRYMAICHPLRYMYVMNPNICVQLTAGSWMIGFLVSFGNTCYIFSLPYCGSNLVAHFFCDASPVLNLICGDTFKFELFILVVCVVGAAIPFLLILCSYINILSSIMLIHSAEGRHKALSTCGSHLTSVFLFYGTSMFVHLRLGSDLSPVNDMMLALFYCIIIPALNPLIYSLRNTDMKKALRKLILNPLKSY
ncbi:olfactory receptor 10A4-like [Spea bombifrons]|uniref:olfactory receptor 10A4-like n=1 Tax=Spea bombifrons TaxID=233779 RepID=UPI00234BEEBF|nr:olfactory receptor 10A4-like [Spea bombifrons]